MKYPAEIDDKLAEQWAEIFEGQCCRIKAGETKSPPGVQGDLGELRSNGTMLGRGQAGDQPSDLLEGDFESAARD